MVTLQPHSCHQIASPSTRHGHLADCRKKKGRLTISWPAMAKVSAAAVVPEAIAAPVIPAAPECPALEKGAARVSLDYSRFDGIEEDDMQPSANAPAPVSQAIPPPMPATAPSPKRSAGGYAELNYSRFEDMSEEDATVPMVELEKIWRQQAQLQRMRGESLEGFAEWQRRRAKQHNASDSGNATGRGLWCRTNMEEAFTAEAQRAADEKPSDADLPALPAPDMLSCMMSAPGVEVVDVKKWACGALREELTKACATDRAAGCKDPSIRVDAIVSTADVGDGSAGIGVEAQQVLCAYRFAVKVSYCVAVSERPVEGDSPSEAKYIGDVIISELASGIAAAGPAYQEALTQRMKTSLREPKPPKRHLAAMRPVLGRLELSLAHFVRRFERRFLAYPALMMQKAS